MKVITSSPVFAVLIALALIGAGVTTLSCKTEMLEFTTADGFKLRLPSNYSFGQISEQLSIHDKLARDSLLALREMDAPAILITGPEGLAFHFNPRNTSDLIRRSLFDMYQPEVVEQILAGKYAGMLPPEARLMLIGKSKDEAEALLSLDLDYVMRKAFADAIRKTEVKRLMKLTSEKQNPLAEPKPIATRIADARTALARERGFICRAVAWCGL